MKNMYMLLLSALVSMSLVAPGLAAGDPVSVQKTVEGVMRNSHALKSIQENRSAVGYEVDRAKAGYGPRLDLTARGGIGRLSNSTTRSYGYNDDVSPYSSVSLIYTQPLWDGFETRGKVREAEATHRSLDHRVVDNATTIALDAIIAHIDVLRRQEILNLSKQNVAAHEEILKKARDRERVGVDTMADVSQAQSRLARARSAQSEAEGYLRIGEETYTRLTNYYTSNLAPVTMPAGMYSSAKEVLDLAYEYNPKVSAFLEDVNAARARKEQARAAYSPRLDLEMGPSYADRDGKDELWTYEFGVAAVVRWNIFNSGADKASNKAAEARIRQARQALYDYIDELKLSVEESWTQFETAKEQLKFYNEAVEYNLATRNAYQEQFVLGQRSLLDVLDAESELFNSASQAATMRGNTLVAAYRMRALTGQLLPGLNIGSGVLAITPPDREPLDSVTVPKRK